jgi:hypothetical protein
VLDLDVDLAGASLAARIDSQATAAPIAAAATRMAISGGAMLERS